MCFAGLIWESLLFETMRYHRPLPLPSPPPGYEFRSLTTWAHYGGPGFTVRNHAEKAVMRITHFKCLPTSGLSKNAPPPR